MKVNVDATLYNLDGQPIVDDQNNNQLTVSDIAIRALFSSAVHGQQPDGEKSYKAYQLAQKIKAGGEVNLTAEEISEIKRCVGKTFLPQVVGPVYDALEG